ncbi:hypothetical protein JAO73_00265 [Hymenobacter sp. BT523]|uniref:hypothetical protein n=1 Tax=Hymenobacter sp. BT523 TaxID=2795725 RepID=UPI0018EDDE1C|nr:hypothetical protein [Hymenobacter sp. BT523]MBJ6107424.1 hypothetical protein [Hymenobacter sp. BT523]
MSKFWSFFLGLLAGLLTGLLLAVLVFVLSNRWTVTQEAAFHSAPATVYEA